MSWNAWGIMGQLHWDKPSSKRFPFFHDVMILEGTLGLQI